MTTRDRTLIGIYGVIAAVAFVATWWNNIAFFVSGTGSSLLDFAHAGYANYAAASLTNDVILVAVAAFVFMVVEARRLEMPRVWVYLVLSVVVAVSVALPLYLIVRQYALARRRSVDPAWECREPGV
jgi:integral membrane sensor domain MASE1